MRADDPVTEFYDRHPYPPPVDDLERFAPSAGDAMRRRVDHHRLWPHRPFRDDITILVAGCGTSQAARYAIRHPAAQVTGIDVSDTGIEHTRALARRHGLDNLDVRRLPIEAAAELASTFDLVVCTGVLHHLADPDAGLRSLTEVVAPDGALSLMVYAPYGRVGVYLIQDYCRRLGIGTSPDEIDDLIATLRELPIGHPLGHRLRNTPDFQHPDALADALLNPRDRPYSVPELLALLERADLEFVRWFRQAPYLPRCGSLSALPHGDRVAALPRDEQYAAVELFRGTMVRHSVIARPRRRPSPPPVRFDDDAWLGYVPLRPHTATAVHERVPDGAAAVLLDRAHEFTDLVLFVDERELAMFEAIDGERPIGDIPDADPAFFERLWEHDLIVIDASDEQGDAVPGGAGETS